MQYRWYNKAAPSPCTVTAVVFGVTPSVDLRAHSHWEKQKSLLLSQLLLSAMHFHKQTLRSALEEVPLSAQENPVLPGFDHQDRLRSNPAVFTTLLVLRRGHHAAHIALPTPAHPLQLSPLPPAR